MHLTAFDTNTADIASTALDLRRQRARAKNRIRAARVTGLRNLPPHMPRRTRSGWRSSRSL